MYAKNILNKSSNLIYSLGILLSVLIGISVSINAKLTLLGIVALLIAILTFMKWELVFGMGLIVFFTVPFDQYEFFKLSIYGLDVFTILFFFILGIIITKALLSRNIKRIKMGSLFYSITGLILIYTFIGIVSNQTFVVAEFKRYLFFIIYPLAIFLFSRIKDGLSFLIKVCLVSSILLSLLIIFIFFFKSTIFSSLFAGTFYEEGTRVAVSNPTIFLISMPILTFAMMYKLLNKYWNMLIMLTIPLMIASALIGESRSLLAGLVCNMSLTILFSLFLSKKRVMGNFLLVGFGLMMIVSITILGLTFFSFGEKLIVVLERFNEFFQTGTTDSFQTRVNTNAYATELIKQNLLGYGVGSNMLLIDSSGNKALDGFFIDSGFITILYKFGILGFILFMCFYAKNLLNVFKIYRQEKKLHRGKLALILLICMPAFLSNTLYMSAQLVTNGVVLGFTLIVFSYFAVSLNKKQVKTINNTSQYNGHNLS